MDTRFFLKNFAGVLCACLLPGCMHCCQKSPNGRAPVVSGFPPSGGAFVPASIYPGQPLPPRPQTIDPTAPSIRMFPPEWRGVPESPGTTQEPPLASPDTGQPRVRLLPPDSSPRQAGPENPGTTAPPLPVGIPQFTMARDRVAGGLKPHLDGLDWLQANGYRTVLHVRAPGQDDSADRREVDKRGLKYLSLEASAQTLTRTVLDEFSRTVADASLFPLFVYDRDGRLAGALWYLHFRFADKSGDDLARTRAARLGLREDDDGEQRALWLAIQKLLSEAGN